LVDVADGREIATAVHEYRSGVIDHHLPGEESILPPDWALQDPDDYLQALGMTVKAVLAQSGIDPARVIGIGIDFTACTMMPVTSDGTPLCRHGDHRSNPHSWVKLWKHHAAQPEADLINETAATMGEPWLDRYGRKTSSEWFFAKALQILDESPEIYASADRLIEAADWIIWQLTGVETRNSTTAGYKALWSRREGFPDRKFFEALNSDFADVVDEKMSRNIANPGERAGSITTSASELTGLVPGTAVAIANVDAHVSVPAATVVSPGRLVAVMGTSTCHIALADVNQVVPGVCGVVEDGVVPGLFGYEAGQAAVGDMFGWLAELVSGGGSRLVEREPLGSGGCRSDRTVDGGDALHPARRNLSGDAGGNCVRHASDHRGNGSSGCPDRRDSRLRGSALPESASDATDSRYHRPAGPGGRVSPDSGFGIGNVCGCRCRARVGWVRVDPGSVFGDGTAW
jgi:L-ribulokinase